MIWSLNTDNMIGDGLRLYEGDMNLVGWVFFWDVMPQNSCINFNTFGVYTRLRPLQVMGLPSPFYIGVLSLSFLLCAVTRLRLTFKDHMRGSQMKVYYVGNFPVTWLIVS